MIKYVIQAKKNPLNKNEVKYYLQMVPTTPMTLAQIVKRVEKRSTVSSADVKAVLDALQYEVIEALEAGNTVRLGDLGSFRLTIKADGVPTAAEAKKKGAQLIKQVNVQFTKSTTTRSTLAFSTLLLRKTSSMLPMEIQAKVRERVAEERISHRTDIVSVRGIHQFYAQKQCFYGAKHTSVTH